MQVARETGLSSDGFKSLAVMIKKYTLTFRIWFGKGSPRIFPLTKIVLDATQKMVKMKVHKYPVEPR